MTDGLPPDFKPPAYIKEGRLYVPKQRGFVLPNAKRGTFPMPFFGGFAGGPTTATYIDAQGDTADTTTRTFESVGLGDSSGSSRKIIGVFSAGQVPTGVTCDGEDCTRQDSESNPQITFWYVDGVTATSGDIVLTLGATSNRGACAVWDCKNLTSGTTVAEVSSSSNSTVTLDMNVNEGGFVLSASYHSHSSSISATSLTENSDTLAENIGSGDLLLKACSEDELTAATPRSQSLTCTGNASRQCETVAISMY